MNPRVRRIPRVLLAGPYDPHCGEYTFLAPPLGIWRLAGVLEAAGVEVKVFDPNCCVGTPQRALERELLRGSWDVIGISTTGMTLRFDLELAHIARRLAPHALLVAGGMEATFRPDLMFELGPFDLVVLGEGERPLLQLCERLRSGQPLGGIGGTAERKADGTILKMPQAALDRDELRDAIFSTPYEKMPYEAYWDKLETAYRVGALPSKAAREAQLAEIRSVRLITLNYCPMGCTFCSATNFLHEAQGSVAPIARLEAAECVSMIERIVAAHPGVRTIIFQDDIFVFTKDKRRPAAVRGHRRGKRARHHSAIPAIHQHQSHRCDVGRAADRHATRGVSRPGLRRRELLAQRPRRIQQRRRFIGISSPCSTAALELGITPFLDLILSSPLSSLEDVAPDIARSVSLAAARLRSRHVPVRDSVLGCGIRA